MYNSISPTPSVVSICGKVPIQEAPNGLPCVVSDAMVRMLGCMDPVDYDQSHCFFVFNFMFIFKSVPGSVYLQYLHGIFDRGHMHNYLQ